MGATIGTVATPGTLGPILKDYYIGPLQEQLNNEVMVLQMFEKAKISWAGRQGIVPVHVGRNTGVGFRGENADWSTGTTALAAGSQTTKRLSFEAAYLYGRFEVTGPAIASAAKGGTASFIGALELEMDKLKEDIRNQADVSAISGGRVVGFLNERKSGAAPATWEFRGNFTKLAKACADKGGNVDIAAVDCSNNTLTGEAVTYELITTVASVDSTAINPAAGTISLTGTLDTTGVAPGFGVALVISDGDANLAYLDQEPVGIYGNLGGELLFGVDRGSDAGDAMELQSVIMAQDVNNNGTAEALTLTRMQEVIDAVSITSGMSPDVILMNPIDRAKYIALLQGSIQMNPQGAAQSGDGGFLGLAYAGIPIKAARHVDRSLMLFLNTKCWKLAVLEDGKFADLDGSVLSRVSGKDSFEGFYKWYYNHYCYRPNANGVLTGISF
ncbi:MAG: hypothetical protein CMQ38_12995 [Gammaproteobacteria bacterium]|nr:hypothetical protein [Gammaproteobacteria bacterium]